MLSPSKTTGMSPFKVVYGVEPLSPLDLTPQPMDIKSNVDASKRVQEIQELHIKIKGKIEHSNATYQAQANKYRRQVIFNPSDLVWVHLRMEWLPSKCKSKIMPRTKGPFEVLERITTRPTSSICLGIIGYPPPSMWLTYHPSLKTIHWRI